MLVPDEHAASQLDLTLEESERLKRFAHFRADGNAYMRLQATRPQTLSYGLTDSPVGQLAWIAEKFHEWSDHRSGQLLSIKRDRIITNVMLYWLTATAGSAARLYFEFARSGGFGPPPPAAVPTGIAIFAYDNVLPVRRIAERDPAVTHWTEFDRGGHFGALEQPELLVEDIRKFFRTLR